MLPVLSQLENRRHLWRCRPLLTFKDGRGSGIPTSHDPTQVQLPVSAWPTLSPGHLKAIAFRKRAHLKCSQGDLSRTLRLATPTAKGPSSSHNLSLRGSRDSLLFVRHHTRDE
jgi:hypothetical protein